MAFFDDLLKIILSIGTDDESGQIPQQLKPYSLGSQGSWKGLSERWKTYKDHYKTQEVSGFYSGISGHTAKAWKATKRKPGTGRSQLGSPFIDYIRGLSNSTEQLLGELRIEYKFIVKDRDFITHNVYNTLEIERVLSTKTGHEVQFPSKFRLEVKVLGFQKLLGTKLDSGRIEEWQIVDRLATISGRPEQWRKINSRTAWGRGGRPIRALMAPMISRWFNEVGTKALTKFMKDLEK